MNRSNRIDKEREGGLWLLNGHALVLLTLFYVIYVPIQHLNKTKTKVHKYTT